MAKKKELNRTITSKKALDLIGGEILDNLQNGKASKNDVRALRQALAEVPELWRISGDMVAITEAALIRDAAGVNELIRHSMVAGLAAVRAGLGYEISPMLERLLIDAAALAWLRWSLTEYHYTSKMLGSLTLAQADYWDRHLNAAQRRYLRALSALARVRKMKLPALQVNIAEQQVNIAGGTL